MAKDKFDVFLSSDQEEFSKIRILLSKSICKNPLLTCTPLENLGAKTTNAVDASLRGVRESEFYVGIFGKEYSETTIKEYREAIRTGKPCLTYVKKLENRDDKIAKFIEEELPKNVTYSRFRGAQDLSKQVESDLNRLIAEILVIGLNKLAKDKEQIMVIEKEEKTQLENTIAIDPLEKARFAFQQSNYIESLVRTTIALRTSLAKLLEMRKIKTEKKSLSELIRLASGERLIDLNQENILREILRFRNSAVHQGNIPDKEVILKAITNAKSLLHELKQKTVFTDKIDTSKELHPQIPKIIDEFICRRKPQKYTEEIFRKIVQEIETISGTKKRVVGDKTVLYKTKRPFVSLELRKERIILHLTLLPTPKENGVEYIRRVYGHLSHAHMIIRSSNQLENSINIIKKAFEASF